MLLSPLVAYAAGATVTVKTDSASYTGAQSISVFGTVTPVPTVAGTYVTIIVTNPSGAQVLAGLAPVSTTDGSYTKGFVAGGSVNWVGGAYSVNATYAPVGTTISGSEVTSFTYSIGGTSGTGLSSAEINYINSTLATLASEVSSLTTAVTSLQNGQTSQGTQISNIASSLTTLSGTVSAMQTSLTGLTGTVGTINTNVAGVQSTLNSDSAGLAAAGQTQTYVLVVAVLTAITLVLVLAVLVRRLS